MNAEGHRAVAAVSWLGVAPLLGVDRPLTLAGVGMAVAFSEGVTSPDIDNTWAAKKVDALVPGRDPSRHRELAHWWLIPVLAWLVIWRHVDDPQAQVLLWAGVVGWASHLAADAVFGQAGYGTRAGIPVVPLLPWRLALGEKVGGGLETVVTWVAYLAAAWMIAGRPMP